MAGRAREYLLTVMLTFLTLGIYHFHYHHRAHDELSRQLGQPNKIRGLVLAYVVLVALALGLPLTAVALSFPVPWIAITMRVAALPLIGAVVLLGIIVVHQYRTLHEARQRVGLPRRGGAKWFLLWHYLGAFLVFGPFVAYYNMVQNYNDVWHAIRHGAVPEGHSVSAQRRADPGPGAMSR